MTDLSDVDTLRIVLEDFPPCAPAYRDSELQVLFSLLQELSGQHPGFDRAFGAARDEIMFRKSQGGMQDST